MKREFDIHGIQYTFNDGSTLYIKANKELQLSVEQAMSYWEASGVTENTSSIYFPSLLEEMLEFSKKQVKEEKKYFIPSIEDIRYFYECEVLINNTWTPTSIMGTLHLEHAFLYYNENKIRTPYLTKEQIKNEKSWILLKNYPGISSYFHTLDDDYGKHWKLSLNPILHTIEIKYCWYDAEHKAQNHTNFIGLCPSINEFRTIMKLLNIK